MNAFIKALTTRSYVSADDVLRMRRRVFGDQVIDRAEMADLLQLGLAAPDGDVSWRQFLGEAMADFFTRQSEPRGYMSEEDGAFLVACLGDPARANDVVLDALAHMVRHASSIPDQVIAYGLEAIRAHVLADERIDAAEAERVRAFLFAAGGDGNVAITRAEAEYLFDLNDAALDGDNAPAWADLFMKGVTNHLMAHIGYEPPSRREALRREAWLDDSSSDFSGFLGRMTSGGFRGILDAYHQRDPRAVLNERRAAEATEAEKLSEEEISWVANRIHRDSHVNDAERALLGHLQMLKGTLPPALDALLDAPATESQTTSG